MTLLYASLTAYAVTFVIASSRLFEPVRMRVPRFTRFLSCRMCVGFWVSLAVSLYSQDLSLLLPIYGLSYFLATQERN